MVVIVTPWGRYRDTIVVIVLQRGLYHTYKSRRKISIYPSTKPPSGL